jgi:hypothetical protein
MKGNPPLLLIRLGISVGKQMGNHCLPEIEYSFDLAADDEVSNVAERLKRKSVSHLVFHQRPIGSKLGKRVTMDPLRVRPAKLRIFELVRRVPQRDLGLHDIGMP